MSAVLPATRAVSPSTIARWDLVLVACATAHVGLLLTWPSIPLIAILLWWNANTVAHNFIHRPFFRSSIGNNLFSNFLTLLFGFPQSLWRQRHLAHHAGTARTIRFTGLLAFEIMLALSVWLVLFLLAPAFLLATYLPGWLVGLFLCQMQGYYEHHTETTSHYGSVYNALFFNDGYHREHHARPGIHWRELPAHKDTGSRGSRWPAVLRWIEVFNLCSLERCVIHSPALQRFVVARHERAMRRLLTKTDPPATVGIVGGGLFPRTALVLERVLPGAKLSLIDLSAENLALARPFLGGDVRCVHSRFDANEISTFEMLVVPLAFIGDREAIYNRPPASSVLVHDWIWRQRGKSTVVSWLLLKRINLVVR